MGKASDWLREERRKTLGDWVAFCLTCGFAQRYFDESEGELPQRVPAVRRRDPLRAAPSAMRASAPRSPSSAKVCGAELRPPTSPWPYPARSLVRLAVAALDDLCGASMLARADRKP